MADIKRLGFVGVGLMGGGMARRIAFRSLTCSSPGPEFNFREENRVCPHVARWHRTSNKRTGSGWLTGP